MMVRQRQPIDIEDLLVWTYRHQKADIVIERGIGLHSLEAAAGGIEIHGSSACGCASVERIGMLGTRIDMSGHGSGDLHPDAEAVHRAVMQLDDRVNGLPRSRLVIQHAARGERPDPMLGAVPRPYPLLTHDGRVAIEWLDRGRRFGLCRVQWSPAWALIDAAQREYSAWHAALRLLAMAVNEGKGLATRVALAPHAPHAPWLYA
jgi:hypothetical protein